MGGVFLIKKILFITICLLMISYTAFAFSEYKTIAKVIEIEDQSSEGEITCQLIKAKILMGRDKDKTVELEYNNVSYTSYSFKINKETKLLIKVSSDEEGNIKGTLINIWRIDYLKKLGIIFLILLIIFGRLKGIRSLLSLIFSGFIIIKYLIPLILEGKNAVLASVICSSVIIIVSFILIAGFTKKSYVAIIGTVGGTLTAGILSYVFTNLCSITGLADEDVMILISYAGINIDFKGLYMSAVIIGTIGVVMDVSMSITSVIFEIKSKSPNIGFIELLQSGLKVGKDVMSTMVNTLVLAYVGSSMPLLIIYITANTSFIEAINTESIAVEVIRSLCGSIGLIVTIPLTCLVATYVVQGHKYNNKKYKRLR